MKKMFVVSLVLVAALTMGCSKKKAQTMPTGGGDTQTEMKKDGDGMGGATYGGAKTEGGAANPCDAAK